VAGSEESFLNAASNDKEFQEALREKKWDKLPELLKKYNIASDKAVIDEIKKVDWQGLSKLRERLTGVELPRN